MNIIVGCERSQRVATELRILGHNAFSCDLQNSTGGHPEYHLKLDIFKALQCGKLVTETGQTITIDNWGMGLFFPDCTYLTCSAEWAYKEGPYHQKIKEGTLTGAARSEARMQAIDFAIKLFNCGIDKISMENPIGVLSRFFRKPDQIIQPYQFGDDASKATCLWLKNLPKLIATDRVTGRFVNGVERWANQTDSGQNNLSQKMGNAARAELRGKTYPGIAKAMAEQWAGPCFDIS